MSALRGAFAYRNRAYDTALASVSVPPSSDK